MKRILSRVLLVIIICTLAIAVALIVVSVQIDDQVIETPNFWPVWNGYQAPY